MKFDHDWEPIHRSICCIEGWVGAIALVGSAAIGAAGAMAASSTQAAGQKQAAQTQADMFNTITAQEQPYIQSGDAAEGDLNYLLGNAPNSSGTGAPSTAVAGLPQGYLMQPFNPTEAQLEAYPGYQFQLQQGQLATESAATPGLGALSGAGLKSLMGFNQGLAASNYNNYFNQYQTQQSNIFNRLSAVAGLGQNAAGNLGNQGAQLGTGIAQAQAAAAGSTAGGIVGATNSLSNGAMMAALLSGKFNGGPSPGYSVPTGTGDMSSVMDLGYGE